MADRQDLVIWVREAIEKLGGKAKVIDIAKAIWTAHSDELKDSDLFYTWQYDMRWAALKLRKNGLLKPVQETPRGIWAIA